MRINGAYDPRRIELRKRQDSAPLNTEEVAAKGDSVKISDKARKANEAYKLSALYSQVPDVRPDRVEQVRSRLERGDYFTREAAEATADRIQLDA